MNNSNFNPNEEIEAMKTTDAAETPVVKLEKTQDKLIISYKIDDNYFTFKIEKV